MISIIQPKLWGGYGFGSDSLSQYYVRGDESVVGGVFTESSPYGKIYTVDKAGGVGPVQDFVDVPAGTPWKASWNFAVPADRGRLLAPAVPNHYTMLSRAFTIECWAKVAGNTGNFQMFVDLSSGGSFNGIYMACLNTTLIIGTMSSPPGLSIAGAVTFGVWQHWILTRDENLNMKLYRDGILIGSVVQPSLGTGCPACVGNRYDDNQFVLWGRICGVRVSRGFCRYRNQPRSPANWPLRKW
jgi:hypothetical protein